MSTSSRRSTSHDTLLWVGAVALVAVPTLAAFVGGPIEVVALAALAGTAGALAYFGWRNWTRSRRVAWLFLFAWALGRPAMLAVAATYLPASFSGWTSRGSILFSLCGGIGTILLCIEARPPLRLTSMLAESLVVTTCGMTALWVAWSPTIDGGHVRQLVPTIALLALQLTVLGVVVMCAAHQPTGSPLRWLCGGLVLTALGSALGAYRYTLSAPLGQASLVLIALVTAVPFLRFASLSTGTAAIPLSEGAERSRPTGPPRFAGRHPIYLAVAVAVGAVAVRIVVAGELSGVFAWLVVVSGVAVVAEQACAYRDSRSVLAALEASDERFRAAFLSAPMGIAIADAEGVVVECNPALSEMLGWPRELIEGLPAAGFMSSTEMAAHDRFQTQLRRGEIDRFTQELTVPHVDGGTRRVSITVSRLDSSRDGAHTIAILQDVTEHHAAQERLEHLATHDALTGLGNRAMLVDHLTAVGPAARLDAPVAAMFIDLDQFKLVNDSLGHAAGDRLLLESAARIQSAVGDAGLVTRFGGDEFCVGLDPAAPSDHLELAQRVVAALRRAVDLGASDLTYPSASVGLAFGRLDSQPDELLSEADAAMYLAKERGRDRVETFTPADRRATRDAHRRVAELHRALAHDELVVHHQPVVDSSSGRIIGSEALVRWDHPEHGVLLPGAFVPVAQATGLIVDLGELVLRRACRDAAEWNRTESLTGPGHQHPLTVAVNVDVHQLARSTFPDTVATALRDTGLDPDLLWLELTETALMTETRAVERTLGRLREMGVHLSVDDFGTGYSSLTYLKRFPVEALKIDRSFIAGLGMHSDDTEIVSALVSLGQRLDLRVVAEGVEQDHQLDILRVLGCPMVQGFLFSPPVCAEELRRQLEAQARSAAQGVHRRGVADVDDPIEALRLHGPAGSPN